MALQRIVRIGITESYSHILSAKLNGTIGFHDPNVAELFMLIGLS